MAEDVIYYSMGFSLLIMLGLAIVFDRLRTRLWWVYEPRARHSAYVGRTPPSPGSGFFAWIPAVARLWSEDVFLQYAGVDGLVMIYFLNYAVDQCAFCAILGGLVLVPTYHSSDWLERELARSNDDDPPSRYSFSKTTVLNIGCSQFELSEDGSKNKFFPECGNDSSWRFALTVVCAWIFTLRALSRLSQMYQKFVHTRQQYLQTKLKCDRPAVDMTHGLTVILENVPRRLRSMEALKAHFERLCGAGSVHSASVIVSDLEKLTALCAARDAAQDDLIEAHSRRAAMAHQLERQLRRRHDRQMRARAVAAAKGGEKGAAAASECACADGSAQADASLASSPAPSSDFLLDDDARGTTGMIEMPVSKTRTETVCSKERAALSALLATSETSMASGTSQRAALSPEPHHLMLPVGGALTCCHGCWPRLDRHYHLSIPYYAQLAREYKDQIRQEHRALMAARLERGKAAKALKATRLAGESDWRGCFWAVDFDDSSDEESTVAKPAAPMHVMELLFTKPVEVSAPAMSRRCGQWCVRQVTKMSAKRARDARDAVCTVFREYVLCDRCCGSTGGFEGFEPSSTAFVTFTRPSAWVLATNSLLAATPFGLKASAAAEPRDVIWANVHIAREAVARRAWVVNLALLLLLVFWTSVVGACSSSVKLLELFFSKRQSDSALSQALNAMLPIIVLLSIINLLPLCFTGLAQLYERSKSNSAVDLSVVDRFFRFQFVNVYVSIFTSAILQELGKAWASPYTFVKSLGRETPSAAFYFARLLLFQCGTTPLWCLRAWPLLSRGYNSSTQEPPELPGMLYGWAFPKVMMTFTIFCTFWIFSPILSAIACVYFVLISFAFRYLILFVHMPCYESGGLFFYEVMDRVCFAIGISNVIFFFWLLAQGFLGYALLAAPLPIIVWSFSGFSEDAYEAPSRRVALGDAVALDAHFLERAGALVLDPALYQQPVLRPDGGGLRSDELERLERADPNDASYENVDDVEGNQQDALSAHVSSPDVIARVSKARSAATRAAFRHSVRQAARTKSIDRDSPHKPSRAEHRRTEFALKCFYAGEADYLGENPPTPSGRRGGAALSQNVVRAQPVFEDDQERDDDETRLRDDDGHDDDADLQARAATRAQFDVLGVSDEQTTPKVTIDHAAADAGDLPETPAQAICQNHAATQ